MSLITAWTYTVHSDTLCILIDIWYISYPAGAYIWVWCTVNGLQKIFFETHTLLSLVCLKCFRKSYSFQKITTNLSSWGQMTVWFPRWLKRTLWLILNLKQKPGPGTCTSAGPETELQLKQKKLQVKTAAVWVCASKTSYCHHYYSGITQNNNGGGGSRRV